MKNLRWAAAVCFLGAALLGAAGCGESGEGDSPGSDDFAFTAPATYPDGSEVSSEDEARWLDTWCTLDGTMDRDEVIELMGEPTSEFEASMGTPQSQWETHTYHYTAFYGNDGSVDQLYINQLEIEPDEAALVECPLVRHF